MSIPTVTLLYWEKGTLRPYKGASLYGALDFYAWRARGSWLICVAVQRANPFVKADYLGISRDVWLYMREHYGVRALEIAAADELKRRDIVRLFDGFNGRPVSW